MRDRRGFGAPGALLLLVLLVGGLAWYFRDSLPFFAAEEVTEVSPEAAVQAEEKLERLRAEGETVRLSAVELSSLLRYRGAQWTTELVHEPSVLMSGDTVRVVGTVSTDRLPSHPELDRIRGLLPDSAQVEVAGGLSTFGPGQAAVQVRSVEFANIPIPERYYPTILERLGRGDEPGLPPGSLPVRLPEGVGSARVEDGHLVLTP